MAKRKDIKRVMIIGSGPIIIGQAAEFDYAGTQACLALKEEGYEVVLVNSNPATIMTDTVIADRDNAFSAETLWKYQTGYYKVLGNSLAPLACLKLMLLTLTPEEISRFPKGQLFCDILVGPNKDTRKLDYWICGDPAYNQLLKLVESQIPEIKVELHNQIEEMIGDAQTILDADMDHIEELVWHFDERASDATNELEEKVNSLDSLIVEKVDLAINNLLEATY